VNPSDLTLLMTRPRSASERFAAALEAETGPFARVIVSPLLEIVPRPAPALPPEAALAFTSENAAALAAPFAAPGRRAYCVGDRTAEAARAAGFEAVSAGGDAAALAARLAADPPGASIVHLAGAHQRGDLVERLRAAGLPAERVTVYDQAARPLSAEARAALAGRSFVLLPLFSPRSAALASAEAAGATAPLLLACLSPAIRADWAGPPPAAETVASGPDATALTAAIARLLAAAPGA